MKICDESYHGEIVHEGKHCLACETIEEFKDQVKSLKDEIDELKAERVLVQTSAVAAKG